MDLGKFYTEEWDRMRGRAPKEITPAPHRGLIDTFLKWGSGFNFITPAWACLCDLFSGGAAHWGVSIYAGATNDEIHNYLKTNGIKSWGMMLNRDGDMWIFSTPKIQARDAYYLFQEAELQVLYTPRCVFE